MGCLTNREGARVLRETVQNQERGDMMAKAILRHFNDIHAQDLPLDFEIERLLLQDEKAGIDNDKSNLTFDKVVTFSPSGASKCKRELFYKACHIEGDNHTFEPYQRRWMRNGTAVHRATQRDLLYAEKYLDRPKFLVMRTEAGLPAWEKSIRRVKQFEHQGVPFQIYGMMDGILEYTPDKTRLGFEFKTKSTTVSAVGTYKMKDAQESHKQQVTAYSLLFDLKEFLLVYESLAKDSWTAGDAAKPDMRAFHVQPTERDREALLDKYAEVAEARYTGELPGIEPDKCLFCTFKTVCQGVAA